MFDSLYLYNDYNTEDALCQEIFNDKQKKLITHMREKDKILKNLVSAAELAGKTKSYISNIIDCGTLIKTDENNVIIQGNFCHARLCPVCAWKRSLKLFHEVNNITKYITAENPKIRFLFITLTQKNVKAEQLNDEISRIMYGFKRFRQFSKISKASLGIIKSLEVTYNSKDNSYHPHIHAVIAVPSSYFKRGSPLYISASDISMLWKRALNINQEKSINTDLQAIKQEEQEKAIAEVCKYAVKLCSVANSENINALSHIMNAIHGRRLFSSSGIFRRAARILKIDLENTAEEEIAEEITENGTNYMIWTKGNYKKSSNQAINQDYGTVQNERCIYKKESVKP